MARLRTTIALGCAILLASTQGRADEPPPPKSVTHDYSPYEKETIKNALESTGREIDPSPEGKIVEGYDVVTLDVFEKRDPIPTFFNVFHWTSRPYTISRELLVHEGEPYRKVLVDETARNLRRLSAQISLVLVVPVKGQKPGTVRLLLITKDVWSLRLNSSFRLAGGRVEYLFLQPSEQNVFGTHHVAAAELFMQPLSYALGGYYKIPWVAGTRVQALAEADVVINRESQRPEGSFGRFVVAYPLWSTRTPWSWEVRYDWRNDVYRRYTNGLLAGFDARATPDPDGIPWLYRRDSNLARAQVLRSFGWASKHDVTMGVQLFRFAYTTYDMSAFAPEARDEFLRRVVPVSDTRVGPFVQYHAYRTDFLRVLDVEILALQEDFRLGHDFIARVYPVFRGLGATRNLLGVDLRAQYTLPLGDGIVRGSVESVVEAQTDRRDAPITDASLESRLRIVSPRTGLGRLIFDGGFVRRFRNYLNVNDSLGSESRPRGYPTRFLFGPNAAAYSLEFRTRPLEILKTQWGLVAFHDAGTAYEGLSDLNIRYAVGAGVRALFPQFDRVAFRLDVGVPVGVKGPPSVILTVDQAFSFPSIRESTTLE